MHGCYYINREKKKTYKELFMYTLEQVRELLSDRVLTVVAKKTGLHYNTVAGVANGRVSNPSYDVIMKLNKYFKGE